jgi:hypothetical protein
VIRGAGAKPGPQAPGPQAPAHKPRAYKPRAYKPRLGNRRARVTPAFASAPRMPAPVTQLLACRRGSDRVHLTRSASAVAGRNRRGASP